MLVYFGAEHCDFIQGQGTFLMPKMHCSIHNYGLWPMTDPRP